METKIHFLQDVYPQYDIGEGSYGGLQVFAWPEGNAKLKIGKYCSFSFETQVLLGGDHRIDWTTTYPFSVLWPEAEHIKGHPRHGDVEIGSDVWVGAGAKILSGVKIGDGAAVGANALVLADVPPYAIAVGNPARVLKMRFSDELIASLMEIRWWDWPREKIVRAIPLLLNTDVREFVYAVGTGELT
jgi:acetyltransferase-like isoleucine patch superfamily enzyme